jgi:hypothetical protein
MLIRTMKNVCSCMLHDVIGIFIVDSGSGSLYFTSGNRTAMSPDCVMYRTHGKD